MDELRAFGGPLHLQCVVVGNDRNPMRVEIEACRQRIWVYTARTLVVSDVAWRVLAPRDYSDGEVASLIDQWVGGEGRPPQSRSADERPAAG